MQSPQVSQKQTKKRAWKSIPRPLQFKSMTKKKNRRNKLKFKASLRQVDTRPTRNTRVYSETFFWWAFIDKQNCSAQSNDDVNTVAWWMLASDGQWDAQRRFRLGLFGPPPSSATMNSMNSSDSSSSPEMSDLSPSPWLTNIQFETLFFLGSFTIECNIQ